MKLSGNTHRKMLLIAFIFTKTFVASAQDAEPSLVPAKLSFFTGGFALIFVAVFAFSFTIKSILNSRTQQWTSKQILKSSLLLAFVVALIMIVGIYFYLSI